MFSSSQSDAKGDAPSTELLDSIGGLVSTGWVDGYQYGVSWYEMSRCLGKLAA